LVSKSLLAGDALRPPSNLRKRLNALFDEISPKNEILPKSRNGGTGMTGENQGIEMVPGHFQRQHNNAPKIKYYLYLNGFSFF